MQLELGELLGAIDALVGDPLHLGRNLPAAGAGTASAKAGGYRLQTGDLLADVEKQALAQQRSLAGKVVGERAQRDPGSRGEAAVADSADPLATDQLECDAQDALAGAGRLAAVALGGDRLNGCGGGHRERIVRSNDLVILRIDARKQYIKPKRGTGGRAGPCRSPTGA